MDIEARRTSTHVHLRVPVDMVQTLRVALQPCPCRAPKSNTTTEARAEVYQALTRGLFMQPEPAK